MPKIKNTKNPENREKLARMAAARERIAKAKQEWSAAAPTPEEATNKAEKYAALAGKYAALSGVRLATSEELQQQNHYTPDQAQAYIQAFNKAVGTPEEQAIREAKKAGQDAAHLGIACVSIQELQDLKHYTPEQAQAYIQAFNEAADTREKQAIQRARNVGRRAAYAGFVCSSIHELQWRNQYTLAQAQAYIAAFNEIAGTPEVQAIRAAKTKGRGAAYKAAARKDASQKLKRPTLVELQKRHYTQQQAQAYLEAYDQSQINKEKTASQGLLFMHQVAPATPRTLGAAELLSTLNTHTHTELEAYQPNESDDEDYLSEKCPSGKPA